MTTSIDAPLTDPETAALDLIVRIGQAVPHATALHGVMRDLAGALHIDGALAGLTTMADARLAAATITEAAVTAEDPVSALRIRAAAVRAGCWDCANPRGLAHALDAAASVMDVL